jgi:adenine-specific DNA-methyltransferase
MDLGQIFTEDTIARYMASLLDLEKKSSILDPCFGDGAFIEALLSYGFTNITGVEIDRSLFEKTQTKFSELTLYNSDFLSFNEEKKYDGIIMNPPYVRQEKIDELFEYGITKEKLQENKIFSNLPGSANLYMYFIIKAIHLLKKDGVLVVIFPGSWANTDNGASFKNALMKQCSLTDLVYVHGKAFRQEALVDVIILKLIKKHLSISTRISSVKIEQDGLTISNDNQGETGDIGFVKGFNTLAEIRRGITTGYNAMYINPEVDDSCTQKIVSTPKQISGYTTRNALCDKVLYSDNTKECQSYLEIWQEKISGEKSPKTLYNRIVEGNSEWYKYKYFDCSGIIFSYFVRNNMKFVDNKNGYLIRDNFYIIYPKISYKLMFALLNNYYTYIQLEEFGKLYGAGLLKLQRYDLEKLMFPDINNFSDKDIKTLEAMSKLLIEKGNANTIDEMTKIISGYSNIGFSDIKKMYFTKKNTRLKKYEN